MDYAAIIKDMVPTPDVLAFYGFPRNRAGFICCPFHNEKTASAKVYDGSRGFYCFGCGEHGDIIDFVQKYFGVSYKEAQSKLNDDFGLGLPIREKVDGVRQREIRHQLQERQRQRDAVRKERERLYTAYNAALDEWTMLDRQRIKYAPEGPSEPIHPLYLVALHNLDYAAYALEGAEIALYLFEKKHQ